MKTNFYLHKELSQNKTFSIHRSQTPARDLKFYFDKSHSQKQTEPEVKVESLALPLEVYASICLPFVVGYLLTI
jgi:hypothetical protein